MTTTQLPWRVPPWAFLLLGAAIVAEAVSNSLRAYGLGKHLDAFTVHIAGADVSLSGAVLVLAAVAISLAQARAAWVAFTPHPLGQRAVAAVAAVLLLAVSVSAMASHILEAQRAKVADEGGARSAYDRAEAAYKRAMTELEALGNPRPVSVIQAEVKAFPIDWPLWQRSRQCEDATKPDTQAYCQPLIDLYKERGSAARKTEIEPDVARLRDELARTDRPEAVSEQETVIGEYWAWIMGLAVVFVATFGSVIFAIPVVSGADCPYVDPTSPSEPENSDCPELVDRKGRMLAFLQTEQALRRIVQRQSELSERFGVPRSTASDWIRRWEAEGVIAPARKVGRRKVFG